MKKRWIAALAAAGILAAANGAGRKDAPAEPAENGGTSEYVLGEYRGRVAVYCPQRGTLPRRITAIEVALLPAADREQLQNGIRVADTTALTMLLEDLGC